MRSQLIIGFLIGLFGLHVFATEIVHIEKQLPIGAYLGSLRAQALSAETVLVQMATDACKDSEVLFFENLEIKITGKGMIYPDQLTDVLDATKASVQVSYPRPYISADVHCK
jgi:hypothetical protein